VDVLSGTIGIGRSKNGYARRVPTNGAVRSALIEIAAQRKRPDDPTERVFPLADLLSVKELGGWSSLRMAERYAHCAPAHLARLLSGWSSRHRPLWNLPVT